MYYYSGILTDYPITWLALAAPLALRDAAGKVAPLLGWFVAVVLSYFSLCAVTDCLFLIASSRYEFDFLPGLMLLAVIGILGLERAVAGSIYRRRVARGIWGLLLVYSILFNVLASIKASATQRCLDGNIYLNEGQLGAAIDCYQKASALDPQSATFHFALGNALSRSGQAEASIGQYQRAIEIAPGDAEAYNNLAYTLLQAGRVDEAVKYFQKAVEIQPSFQADYNLAYACQRNGMAAQAVACYRQALELQPGFVPAKINLAWILATWPDSLVRNGNEALALAEEANQAAKDTDPKILRTLAAAYAATGHFPEALVTAKKALALAQALSRPALVNQLQGEIDFYQKGSPCRTTSCF